MSKTYTPKQNDVQQSWHLVDANDRVLGDVASEIAVVLMGKHKAMYTPNINVGDKVVVVNAKKVSVSGNKKEKKIYYRHTGYPGGVKYETLGKLMERRPNEALRRAVKGMLPKNKLQKVRMRNLFIYEDENHPHQAQVK